MLLVILEDRSPKFGYVKLAEDINDPCQLEAIGAAVKMDPPVGVKLGIAS